MLKINIPITARNFRIRSSVEGVIKPFQVPFPQVLYTFFEWKNGIANEGAQNVYAFFTN